MVNPSSGLFPLIPSHFNTVGLLRQSVDIPPEFGYQIHRRGAENTGEIMEIGLESRLQPAFSA